MPAKKKSAKSPKKKAAVATDAKATERNATTQNAYIRASLEAQLDTMKDRVARLQTECNVLRKGSAKVEQDTHEFVSFFEREREMLDVAVAELRDRCRQLEYDKERDAEAAQVRYATDTERLKAEAARTKSELSERLADAEAALTALRDFRDHKELVEGKVLKLSDAMKAAEEAHAAKLEYVEREFMKEKSRMQREHDAEIAEIKKRSREEAQKGLDADTRRIVADNLRMSEELRFQLETTGELQRMNTEAEEENRRLKREVELFAEKEREFSRLAHQRSKEVDELKSRVAALERSLNVAVRDAEKEREMLLMKHQEELEELRLEVGGLRQLVKLKNKELRTIKKLAHIILSQRSDVEQFFLETLEVVRRERAAAEEDASREAHTELSRALRDTVALRGVKLPAVRDATRTDTGTKRKVDLRELSWDDRERVLRLLFARINNVTATHSDAAESGGMGATAASAALLSPAGGDDGDDGEGDDGGLRGRGGWV